MLFIICVVSVWFMGFSDFWYCVLNSGILFWYFVYMLVLRASTAVCKGFSNWNLGLHGFSNWAGCGFTCE